MAMQNAGSFVAKDSAGKKYTIHMYRKVIDTTHMQSTSRETTLGSLLTLQTSDGQHVNGIEKGSYEILHRNLGVIKVTSDDPKAP